jgi:hypothetical protein
MNKKYLLAAFVVLIGCVAAVFLYWFPATSSIGPTTEKEMNDRAKQLGLQSSVPADTARSLDSSKTVRVAIGALGFPDENQNRNAGDSVLAELKSAHGLEMVERQELDKALSEMQLSLSGLVRANDAIRVGKLLRADWFVLGTPARLNGTNLLVIRIVDARTGILQDACGLNSELPLPQLSHELARFIQQCRQLAASDSPRVYLAVGTFQDLSLNNRVPDVPQKLRSYLTAAYRGSSITLLEREFVSTLLNEETLDLAGLTGGNETNAPAPMQSAFWTVDGSYQSYETTNLQVELVLNVQKTFGRHQEIVLRDVPGEPLFAQVKAAVDQAMHRDNARPSLSRATEIKSELKAGKELARLSDDDWISHIWISRYDELPREEAARLGRNTEEALRALQTVLLLDPTNREAKICIASCLRKSYIRRIEEARGIYRDILEAGIEDRWTGVAQQALINSFEWEPADSKQQWFKSAAETAKNNSAVTFYRAQSLVASKEAVLEKRGTPEAEKLAETNLFTDLQKWQTDLENHTFVVDFRNTGLGRYVESFGTNTDVAAAHLAELLPRLQTALPKLAPYLLAGVVYYQVDTNAPVINQFKQSLVENSQNPERLAWPEYYFQLVSGPLSYWSTDQKLYDLITALFEARSAAAARGYGERLDDHDTIVLGFSYMASQQWQKALGVFESYSNRPVSMSTDGLWGPLPTEVHPSREANYCRRQLGLPQVTDPRWFRLDTNRISFNARFAFAADQEGLWVAVGNRLLNLDFNLQTNKAFSLALDSSRFVTAVCSGPSNVWIGTSDSGLINFNRATHQSRRLTENDGLLLDNISSLHLDGDTLWIGYGDPVNFGYDGRVEGGFGSLNIRSSKITSFTASLVENTKTAVQPPMAIVGTIRTAANGDPWLLVLGELYHYQVASNSWDLPVGHWNGGLAIDGNRLITTRTEWFVEKFDVRLASTATNSSSPGQTNIFMTADELAKLRVTLRTNRTQRIALAKAVTRDKSNAEIHSWANPSTPATFTSEELPHPAEVFACRDDIIWAGGEGYIAAINAKDGKILRLDYVSSGHIDQMEIGGDYLWISYNQTLFRTPLHF